jgi:nucleoside-triphosphatase THEP1
LQKYTYKPLRAVWLKAAVMGSLWASFEIIAGSFLHNLRIPFSGTTLTFASVFLVIAFIQFWDDKGLVWRAGLICALMKSLSPSAVIIGPMVGILTEALIIEVFIRISGRNLISYMIAGGLAVASALIHKIISLLILYGFNLVRIIESLYQFSVRQLSFISLKPLQLLLLLISIYLIAGMIAAILGFLTGKKMKRQIPDFEIQKQVTLSSSTRHFNIKTHQQYSIPLLFLHFAIMVTTLWLINTGRVYIYLPLSILYIISCFIWYKNSLRHFRKFSFWIYFTIITLLAAFLLEAYSSGNYFSLAGLVIGLKMNLRAFIIMVGFTAISTELKNPLIRSILYHRGFSNLYQSLNLAFSALPGIMEGMPSSANLYRNRKSFLSHLFNHSRELLGQFTANHYQRPAVFILAGIPGQGKTTFLRELVKTLIKQGIQVDGFLSEGIEENGIRSGFDLIDISSHERIEIARKIPKEGWLRQGHYYFDHNVFENSGERLIKKATDDTQLLVIDEIGPLEMNDGGWAPFIEKIIGSSRTPMFWVVRKSLAKRAAIKWNVGDVIIFELHQDKEEDIIKIIKEMLTR